MAKKKKKNVLPSGSIRKQVNDYDENGKRFKRSFTGQSVEEVDMMIAAFKLERNCLKKAREGQKPIKMTLADACQLYIDSSEAVLSPATVRGYTNIVKYLRESSLGSCQLSKVTNLDLQEWISSMSASGLSPKTVSNRWGLVESTLRRFMPEFRANVTLPRRRPSARYTPSDKDVRAVVSTIKDPDLLAAVMLYAFGPMRRSEICALTWDDIDGCRITVNKALVRDKAGKWVVKDSPKEVASFRVIDFPPQVIALLPRREGRIIRSNPESLSSRFGALVDAMGLPHFSLHDLRHYSASVMHLIGVPDKYIMARGGWATDQVMKTVYQSVINDELPAQTARINGHFLDVIESSGTRVAHGQ